MLLPKLVEGLPYCLLTGDLEREISSICYDSRKVKPGSLFVAIGGLRQDGHAFIPHSLEAGASVIVMESNAALPIIPPGTTLLKVPHARSALARISANFYHHPSRRIRLIGVTGTNGKTTTTYLIESLFSGAGYRTGVIGTINYRFAGKERTAERTTPESADLQKLLAEMVEGGIEVVVMEVSSHSLELERVAGCEFDLAIFTNLTHDHLDFHGDLEHYLSAKLRLFSGLGKDGHKGSRKMALINADDPSAGKVFGITLAEAWGYGLKERAHIKASRLELTLEGIQMDIQTPRGSFALQSPLIGEHNAYNILAAVGAGVWGDIPDPMIAEGIAQVGKVPGRWEKIQGGQKFTVVVDYAHTGDALERILKAARRLCQGRLIAVFGCGGDRDRAKRPIMGEVASRYSDYFIITSDNPRSEDPLTIISEIEEGIIKVHPGRDNYDKIVDRKMAIRKAIEMAQDEDLLVIAGKGHESYQIFREGTIPFDDREIAQACIRERLRRVG